MIVPAAAPEDRRRRRWPRKTRRDVLLRCFFRCTYPGCANLARDMHHAILHSEGGLRTPENVIGLCHACHVEIHARTDPIFDSDSQRWLEPLQAARDWLARQIENCPVRVDNVARSELFKEVLCATQSVDGMLYHTQAVYDSNHWSVYDVFLKAAWSYLVEEGESESRQAAILLLKMVQLYRRRQGKEFQRAARRRLLELESLLSTLSQSEGLDWIRGVITYEQAYMEFLKEAASEGTANRFDRSERLERLYGRKRGVLVSRAQGMVARMRRSAYGGAAIEMCQSKLLRIQDQLAGDDDPLARSWVERSIPLHCAYGDLLAGKDEQVIRCVGALADLGLGGALWYRGVAMARQGDVERGILDLEAARRSFYRDARAERRADLLVALGDCYSLARRREEAARAYAEAVRQPEHMDNQTGRRAAQLRVRLAVREAIDNPADIYLA